MVRLKHRYLLVNFLYPKPSNSSSTTTKSAKSTTVPSVVNFHAPSSDRLDAHLLLRLIRNGVTDLFGDYGSGVVAGSLQVKYLSAATSTAIIRVTRDHYRLVWAALTYITRLPHPIEQDCVIQVVRVSGTIKKSEEEAIRRARAAILKASRTAGDTDIIGELLSGSNGSDDHGRDEDRDVGMRTIEDDDEEEEDDDDAD